MARRRTDVLVNAASVKVYRTLLTDLDQKNFVVIFVRFEIESKFLPLKILRNPQK